MGQRPLGEAPTIATERAARRFSTGLREKAELLGVLITIPSFVWRFFFYLTVSE
jgi:hypothetical protein